MTPLYVGIDLGGSGTRAALADLHGEVLATGMGGSSGARGDATGRREIERALAAALAPIARRIGVQECVVHAGVRGTSVAGRREAVLVALSALVPGARTAASSDATIAVAGALGSGDGVAVLAGTGSVALARSADGHSARAGGHGYLVGDEGSGYWLGREALTACLRALDGRDPPTALLRPVCSAARGSLADGQPLSSSAREALARGLVAWLYAGHDQIPRLAALAPLVTHAAAEGDQVALTIVTRAAKLLAELAAAAAHNLWDATLPSPLNVAPCGNVWSAGEILSEPFEAQLHQLLPNAMIVEPRLKPVGGAVLLAMGSAEPQVVDRLSVALS